MNRRIVFLKVHFGQNTKNIVLSTVFLYLFIGLIGDLPFSLIFGNGGRSDNQPRVRRSQYRASFVTPALKLFGSFVAKYTEAKYRVYVRGSCRRLPKPS